MPNKFKCDKCDRAFPTSWGLVVHKGKAHMPDSERAAMQGYAKCDVCGRVFRGRKQHTVNQTLARHMKVIHGNNGNATTPRNGSGSAARQTIREVMLHFCPNCGTDLHAVATGLAMAKLGG